MQFSEMRNRPESLVPVELRRELSFQKIASHIQGFDETEPGRGSAPLPGLVWFVTSAACSAGNR